MCVEVSEWRETLFASDVRRGRDDGVREGRRSVVTEGACESGEREMKRCFEEEESL